LTAARFRANLGLTRRLEARGAEQGGIVTHRRRVLGLATAAVAAACVLLAPPAMADTIHVGPGESIQDAINRANPGDVIRVHPSVYREQLFLLPGDDNITLRGRGATLRPPLQPTNSPCGETGICLIGSDNDPLQNMRIRNLNVRGFQTNGILAVNANNLLLDRVDVHRNQLLGVFVRDTGIAMSHTTATANGEGGAAIVDPPPGGLRVTRSRFTGNQGAGINVFNPQGGRVERNVVSRNCGGLLLQKLSPDVPLLTALAVRNSTFSRNTRACAAEGSEPALSGLGIGVFGASNVRVSQNCVTGNRPTGPTENAGGIVIGRSGDLVPTNIAITGNVLTHNRPANIATDPEAGVHISRRTRRSFRQECIRRSRR
jgi:nitrous oxidase accessory protein NosD